MSAAGGSERRLGFVDVKADNFHANTYRDLLRGDLAGRGWTLAACRAEQVEGGRAWAKAAGVPHAETWDELNDRCDAFVVLAPSNPEAHLPMVKALAGYGKPVWVDKTFATGLADARAIFAVADAAGIPLETCSALRSTAAQAAARDLGRDALRHVVAWAPGGTAREYLVHPLEMAVSVLGPGAVRLERRGDDKNWQVFIEFTGGRTALVHLALGSDLPFSATLATREEVRHVTVDGDTLFRDAFSSVLDFLDRRAPTFDRAETLAIMALLEAALGAVPGGPAVAVPPV